jgi:hypothetical protein
VLGDIKDGVQNVQIGEAHVAALCRQTVLDLALLRFGEFPAVSHHDH